VRLLASGGSLIGDPYACVLTGCNYSFFTSMFE